MESLRKWVNVELVSNEGRMKKAQSGLAHS